MARTALILLTAVRAGVSIADAALTDANTDGHKFVNDGRTVLVLQNTNAASRTVTVQITQKVDGQPATNLPIVVPATTGRLVTAYFPKTIYDQSTGEVYLDYSATAGLKVAAVKIPKEILP